jgi:hypothetical protein
MNNLVKDMNYAAKKSDMAAKPNNNMDTAAEAMQNNPNLKTRTMKCELARSLNTVTQAYVQPVYGNSISALARLRKMAAHVTIQQFRGLSPVWTPVWNLKYSIWPMANSTSCQKKQIMYLSRYLKFNGMCFVLN